jgi:hypothetical protein
MADAGFLPLKAPRGSRRHGPPVPRLADAEAKAADSTAGDVPPARSKRTPRKGAASDRLPRTRSMTSETPSRSDVGAARAVAAATRPDDAAGHVLAAAEARAVSAERRHEAAQAAMKQLESSRAAASARAEAAEGRASASEAAAATCKREAIGWEGARETLEAALAASKLQHADELSLVRSDMLRVQNELARVQNETSLPHAEAARLQHDLSKQRQPTDSAEAACEQAKTACEQAKVRAPCARGWGVRVRSGDGARACACSGVACCIR